MEKIGNSRAKAMVEEMQVYPIEVVHVPGAKMELLDHGSRNPISYGQHKVFDAEAGSLGVCQRSNRVVPMESTDVKDPKVERLPVMALQDEAYMRDVDHVRNQSKLEKVEKTSELRQLRGDWKELSVISLERGYLIIRGDREILIPKDGRQ